MKVIYKLGIFLFVFLAASPVHAEKHKKKKRKKKNQMEIVELNMEDTTTKVSYALGMSIVSTYMNQGVDSIDQVAFAEGMKAVIAGDSTLMSESEVNDLLRAYFTKLKEEKSKMAAKEGVLFLTENSKKEGVNVTTSGLQYKVMTPGEGSHPLVTDKVTVHYTGMTIDGKVFDSSVERGEPATFGLNQVIPGWTEGVQLMSVGGKYRFFIPSELAYGERGAGGDIAPFSTLIFDVELLKIE